MNAAGAEVGVGDAADAAAVDDDDVAVAAGEVFVASYSVMAAAYSAEEEYEQGKSCLED